MRPTADNDIGHDKFRDECGVFGIYGHPEAPALTRLGLYAPQHRGQESAGIATSDGSQLYLHKAMGLVSRVFDEESLIGLPGSLAIGHTRYSTTGSSQLANAQPLTVQSAGEELIIGHNGNVTNAEPLRRELEEQGCPFFSSTDTEVIGQLIMHSPGATLPQRIRSAMHRLQGAYSLVLLTQEAVYAVRDSLGFRPLCYGRLNGGWVVASESCALDHIGAEFIREVDPGEAVLIDDDGLRTVCRRPMDKTATCMFEHIYFARPDSILDGKLVYGSRMAMGAELAREYPVDADMVIGAVLVRNIGGRAA